MSDFKCDACGHRGDEVKHHAPSGINLCADRQVCLNRKPLTETERAAKICERRATDLMLEAEEQRDWLLDWEWTTVCCKANALKDAAREIRGSL